MELAAPPRRLRSNFVNGRKQMPVRFSPEDWLRPASGGRRDGRRHAPTRLEGRPWLKSPRGTADRLGMWLDLLALVILAVFATVGAMRGALATGLGLLSLVVAYVAGVVGAPWLGGPLGARLEWPEIVALPLAGTLCFFAVYALAGGLSSLIRRWSRRHDSNRSKRDRFLGASLGLVRGALLVLLVSWLALWVDALRATGTLDALPSIEGSAAAAVTADVVESGVGAALGDRGAAGRVAARMASRPGVAITELQSVLEDPQVEALRGDEAFWSDVEANRIDAALERSAFQDVLGDAALRQRLAELGLVGQNAAGDPRAFRAEMAQVLRELAPRLRGLRNDPALRKLAEDPQVVAMAQRGDTLGLLRHQAFRDLVDHVTSRP